MKMWKCEAVKPDDYVDLEENGGTKSFIIHLKVLKSTTKKHMQGLKSTTIQNTHIITLLKFKI